MLKSTVSAINMSGRICNQLHFNVSSNPLSVQSVRWRKPIHLGTAKSKMFRVPPRRKEDPEERAELYRLSSNYRTMMKSITEYFRQENILRAQKQATIHTSADDDLDYERSKALSDDWNASVAKLREIRLAKENADREAEILSELDARRELEEAARQRTDELVRKETEASKTYIIPEKLDAAIDYALTHPVDHNYAIDLKGNIYPGRSGVSETPKVKENEAGSY